MAMKKRYRNYNYYPNKRRKRVKINKVRFTIFILSCVLILGVIGFGFKMMLTDKVEVSVELTEDLNKEEGESLYELSLWWEALKIDDYKEIQITVRC